MTFSSETASEISPKVSKIEKKIVDLKTTETMKKEGHISLTEQKTQARQMC